MIVQVHFLYCIIRRNNILQCHSYGYWIIKLTASIILSFVLRQTFAKNKVHTSTDCFNKYNLEAYLVDVFYSSFYKRTMVFGKKRFSLKW